MRRSPGAARFAAAHRSAFLLHGEKSTATPMLRPAMPIAGVRAANRSSFLQGRSVVAVILSNQQLSVVGKAGEASLGGLRDELTRLNWQGLYIDG